MLLRASTRRLSALRKAHSRTCAFAGLLSAALKCKSARARSTWRQAEGGSHIWRSLDAIWFSPRSGAQRGPYRSQCDRTLCLRIDALFDHHGANLLQDGVLLRGTLLLRELQLTLPHNLQRDFLLIIGAEGLNKILRLGKLSLLYILVHALDLQHFADVFDDS